MSAAPAGDLAIYRGRSPQTVVLDAGLDGEAADRAEQSANKWIKSLRHATVDGISFRDRFTFRDDSLWWFAEVYLHKRRVVARAHRVVAALEALAAHGDASRWDVLTPDPVIAHLAPLVAARFGIGCRTTARAPGAQRLRDRAKAVFHTATSMADRLRPVDKASLPSAAGVAAFLHSAFFRAEGEEPYTGPVLEHLRTRLPDDTLQIVGVGPRTNFRIRRWRDRLREFADAHGRDRPFTPVEAFSGWQALRPSLEVWRRRGDVYRALSGSAALRNAAFVGGYDVWPLLDPELEGIASLQFPWSTRAMDEAGAALDRLQPKVVVTYAEAGGWGRALVLEARRRGIPTVAVQHGFIYRHWLNYLHEPDEMTPSAANPADVGFPRPTRTLLFDQFAAEHLQVRGHFPPESLVVTGSPRLDAMLAQAAAVAEGRAGTRRRLGLHEAQRLVVVAAKHSQMADAFGALSRTIRGMPDVRLIVKPHPAEGPRPYLDAADGIDNVQVAEPTTGLAELLAAADLLVTVNSTAAIEAMAFDVPALVVGLPNNLSPFVDAGAMAGAGDPAATGRLLEALLYDGRMRESLAAARRAFAARYHIAADGQAARRAADAILDLIGTARERDD